jgi:hypothetical protein
MSMRHPDFVPYSRRRTNREWQRHARMPPTSPMPPTEVAAGQSRLLDHEESAPPPSAENRRRHAVDDAQHRLCASSLLLIGSSSTRLIGRTALEDFHPYLYWAVILATSTAGTTMSDYMDRTLKLGYPLGASILATTLVLRPGSHVAW